MITLVKIQSSMFLNSLLLKRKSPPPLAYLTYVCFLSNGCAFFVPKGNLNCTTSPPFYVLLLEKHISSLFRCRDNIKIICVIRISNFEFS